jgi:hypothetical protein
VSVHVIRYDGVDYPVTPDSLSRVFRQISAQAANCPAQSSRYGSMRLAKENP